MKSTHEISNPESFINSDSFEGIWNENVKNVILKEIHFDNLTSDEYFEHYEKKLCFLKKAILDQRAVRVWLYQNVVYCLSI